MGARGAWLLGLEAALVCFDFFFDFFLDFFEVFFLDFFLCFFNEEVADGLRSN
jgi:hypothetical protein